MTDITLYPEYQNCSCCVFWNINDNPILARVPGRPDTVEVAQCLACGAEDDAPCAETHHVESFVFTPAVACCDAFRLHPELEREILDSLETYRELDVYMTRQVA